MTRRVSAYYDGELSTDVHEEFKNHLEGCPDCGAALREISEIATLIRSNAPAEIPKAAKARLHRSVYQNDALDLLPVARGLAGVATVLLIVSLCLSWVYEGVERNFPAANRGWEEIATAGQQEGDVLEEPEAQLAQWVVAGLSRRNAE